MKEKDKIGCSDIRCGWVHDFHVPKGCSVILCASSKNTHLIQFKSNLWSLYPLKGLKMKQKDPNREQIFLAGVYFIWDYGPGISKFFHCHLWQILSEAVIDSFYHIQEYKTTSTPHKLLAMHESNCIMIFHYL